MLVVTILQTGYVRIGDDGSSRANGTVTLISQYADRDSFTRMSPPLFNLLVDTGSPFDGPQIHEKLEDLRVRVAGVNAVVGTHGHVDHVGNLNLFAQTGETVFYLGGDKLTPEDTYESIQFDEKTDVTLPSTTAPGRKVTLKDAALLRGPEMGDSLLSDRLYLLKTPGHTESDLSVAVISEQVLMTCADCGILTGLPLDDTCQTCAGFISRSRGCGVVVVAGDLFEDENDKDDDGAAWKANSWNSHIQQESRSRIESIADVIVPGHGRPFIIG